jgi:hypothetical protein
MAAAQPRSHITLAMRQWVGTESSPLVSPPIELGEIRRTAIAVYWPEVPPRLYWDADYAKKTSWGGIIAPQEHNPFAWMVGRAHVGPQPDRMDEEQARIEESRNLRPPGAPTRYLFGSIAADYFVVMRPGDVITSVVKATDLYEREGRSGLLLFYVTEERWTNQRDEPVKTTRTVNILF